MRRPIRIEFAGALNRSAGYTYLLNAPSLVSNLVFRSAVRRWTNGTVVAGQEYGFAFDDIGNRQTATVNSNVSAYVANLLNQYTQRTVPGSFWEMGSAHSNATVTVNQAVAARQGEYFASQLALANTNSAVYTAVVTVATLTTTTNGEPVQATSGSTSTNTNTSGSNKPEWLYNEKGQLIKKLPNGKEKVMPGTAGGNNTGGITIYSETGGVTTVSVSLTNTGHAFLPKTPEIFNHDSDGSLTNDGRWAYTWDAENRLIGMETVSSVTNIVPRTKLEFAYDAGSRRIQKKVYSWNTDSWFLTSDLRFVYDGWNLLAEVGTTGSVVRSYVWGLDLSGTEQGAGGIGGLLWANLPQASNTQARGSHFVAFDGNGNVAALLNAQTAQVSAEYEYGPFGETIRATGPAAAENVFRFSAKYTDPETGLLNYGFRYYQPSTGRWLSRDPMGEVAEVSLHSYVYNNPNSFIDDTGLAPAVVEVGPNRPAGLSTEYPGTPGVIGINILPNGSTTLANGYYNLPTRRTCGPDVAASLELTLQAITDDYMAAGSIKKCARCYVLKNPVTAWDAWDIIPLKELGYGQNYQFGGTRGRGVANDDRTVAFKGKCYYASAVNYAMWGKVNALCNSTFGNVPHFKLPTCLAEQFLWKALFLWQGNLDAAAFTRFGYNGTDPSGSALNATSVDPTNISHQSKNSNSMRWRWGLYASFTQ